MSNYNIQVPNDPPVLAIWDGDTAKVLLTIRVENNQLKAEYDEADLDEAARKFVAEVLRVDREIRGDPL